MRIQTFEVSITRSSYPEYCCVVLSETQVRSSTIRMFTQFSQPDSKNYEKTVILHCRYRIMFPTCSNVLTNPQLWQARVFLAEISSGGAAHSRSSTLELAGLLMFSQCLRSDCFVLVATQYPTRICVCLFVRVCVYLLSDGTRHVHVSIFVSLVCSECVVDFCP